MAAAAHLLLEIPVLVGRAAPFIAKGVARKTIAYLIWLLLPSQLSNTIPMAVLLGILTACGRLSADREFVALQACGVSVLRLLRPVGLVACAGAAATAYVIIVSLPGANQRFNEITLHLAATTLERNVQPRVFFTDFPNLVIYVRDVRLDGRWSGVFLADGRQTGTTVVYTAREGGVLVDRAARTVQVRLAHGSRFNTVIGRPDEFESAEFDSLAMRLDPSMVFPPPPAKGPPESTMAELRRIIADAAQRGDPAYPERFMLQYRLSFPLSCLALGLIGPGLGMSNRRGGRLVSFVAGTAVVFVYYLLVYLARALAFGGLMNPELVAWLPHVLLGTIGIALLIWRRRAADQPFRIRIPALRAFTTRQPADNAAISEMPREPTGEGFMLWVPHMDLPRPRLLDLYVGWQWLRTFAVATFGLLAVFYIATFIELADKLFRGRAPTWLLLRYFYYQTPQFTYWTVPMAGLLATLVTIAVLSRHSELIVMRACGISLYRTGVPVLLFAAAGSAALFGLEERVLPRANREAERLNGLIRGHPVQAVDPLNGRWMSGAGGAIYHYDSFMPARNLFEHFTRYDLDESRWEIRRITHLDRVRLERRASLDQRPLYVWKADTGWSRTLAHAERATNMRLARQEVALDSPDYFTRDIPDASGLTYGQLTEYIARLQAGGSNAVPQLVQLHTRLAFPMAPIIMTLIAVTFAALTGRHRALYGIGLGIVLAALYRTAQIVFGGLGESGAIAPFLAAWAPNILFGVLAVYSTLTVRT